MNNYNKLKDIVKLQKQGKAIGIYSACSANEFVLKAVLEKAKETNSVALIEATANQCNQFGGYTNMTPFDFKKHIDELCDEIGLDKNDVFLGGDHLGPLNWTDKGEKEAMELSKQLIHDYVLAGFTKIHIDTSMKMCDDPEGRLSDDTIAKRGAILAKVVKDAYNELLDSNPSAIKPVIIVGSEVPIPGGQTLASSSTMNITTPEDFNNTVKTFKKHFKDLGIEDMWDDVIGVVVQPGMEEKDAGCTEYDHDLAKNLTDEIKKYDDIVFEGHSSDYQTKYKLKQLVEDGVAILKVGPGLTFAMREGLFDLAMIEDELFNNKLIDHKSDLKHVLDKEMNANPDKWKKYYTGSDGEIEIKKQYSFSDRCRYYMPLESIQASIKTLFDNLKDGVPLNLLSQYMPIQYTKVREGNLKNDPEELVKDRIKNCIDEYLFATHQELLKK